MARAPRLSGLSIDVQGYGIDSPHAGKGWALDVKRGKTPIFELDFSGRISVRGRPVFDTRKRCP